MLVHLFARKKSSLLLVLALFLFVSMENASANSPGSGRRRRRRTRELVLDFEDEEDNFLQGVKDMVASSPQSSSGLEGRKLVAVEDELCCGGADDFDFFMQEIDLFGLAIATVRDGYKRIPGSNKAECEAACVTDENENCLDACACRESCDFNPLTNDNAEILHKYCYEDCGTRTFADTCQSDECFSNCDQLCKEQCRGLYNGYIITLGPGGYTRYQAFMAMMECVNGFSCSADSETEAQRGMWCELAKNFWEPEYSCFFEPDVSFTCTCVAGACDIGPYECPATEEECPEIISGGRSASPSASPSDVPSPSPSESPSSSPSASPTPVPTVSPTNAPTEFPSSSPTEVPTDFPTNAPTENPTNSPTSLPTSSPTVSPTNIPTSSPTNAPTVSPTYKPTSAPTGSKVYIDGNPSCYDLGFDYGYKFDGCSNANDGSIFSGSEWPGPPPNCDISPFQYSQYTLICGTGNNRDKAYVTTTTPTSTFTKGGTGGTLQHTSPGVEIELITGNRKGISHISFCFNCPNL